jgi:hypothetical protein
MNPCLDDSISLYTVTDVWRWTLPYSQSNLKGLPEWATQQEDPEKWPLCQLYSTYGRLF